MTIFTGANAPAVGLTETNALSDALRALGMRVIVGDDLNQSARLIKDAIAQGAKFPIISLEDKTGIGKKSFLSRYAKTGHKVVIVSSAPGSIIDSPESTYVPTPTRLGDILVAAGFNVDANDPRLASVVNDSYDLEPSGGAPAAAPAVKTPVDDFADVPAPAVAAPRDTAPASRREARVAAAPAPDLDDPFADVPEAKVDASGEPVAWIHPSAHTPVVEDEYPAPAPVASPVVAEESFGDDEPDWMNPSAPAPVVAAPVAPVSQAVEEEEPDWMKPDAPTSSTPDPDEAPEWTQSVAARAHQNQADDAWLDAASPTDDGSYTHAGRHTEGDAVAEEEEVAEEVALPIFDDAPLDAGFDPDWEPEEEQPAVDLNEPTSFIPAPTSPMIARPRATQVEPSWMDTTDESEAASAEEPKWMQETLEAIPEVDAAAPVVTQSVDDFEIIAPVFAVDPAAPVVHAEAPQRSFDEIMNDMIDSASTPPVVAPTPAPATPAHGGIPAFNPNDSAMWASAPAPGTEVPATFRPEPAPEKLCPIIVSMASKGGVGKTTIATALAERAAKAGLRVTLIDGNRGQGGVRKFLRVNERVVSIYDAAVRSDPKVAIAYPKEIAAARDPKLPPINFAVVLAPPDALADPSVVTAQMYAEAVRYARSVSDLVILDTQISERFDTTGIIESVAIPAIGSVGGFGIGITDDSNEGIRNLAERLEHFSSIGIGREHLLSIVNKMGYFDDSIVASIRSRYDQNSVFVGVVGMDDDFKNKHNVGIIDVDSSSLAPALTAILRNTTGDARFAQPIAEPPKRGGLFGRR